MRQLQGTVATERGRLLCLLFVRIGEVSADSGTALLLLLIATSRGLAGDYRDGEPAGDLVHASADYGRSLRSVLVTMVGVGIVLMKVGQGRMRMLVGVTNSWRV